MRIEPVAARKSWAGHAALSGSAAIHALLLFGLLSLATGKAVDSYTVDLVIRESIRETPAPAQEKPEPARKPGNPPPPKRVVRKAARHEPPRPVFGVTRESVTTADSATVVSLGNTLMKEPESKPVDPRTIETYLAPEVYSLGEVDSAPRPRNIVEPKYPLAAKRANREGVVKLRFRVDKDGRVSGIEVLAAPDSRYFEEAAVAAVRQWVFEPATLKGAAVPVLVVQSIRFQLN